MKNFVHVFNGKILSGAPLCAPPGILRSKNSGIGRVNY